MATTKKKKASTKTTSKRAVTKKCCYDSSKLVFMGMATFVIIVICFLFIEMFH